MFGNLQVPNRFEILATRLERRRMQPRSAYEGTSTSAGGKWQTKGLEVNFDTKGFSSNERYLYFMNVTLITMWTVFSFKC